MTTNKKKPGRPEKLTGKRTKIIKAKLTDDEFKQLLAIEKEAGINRMELIRLRVLHQSNRVLVNGATLLQQLDALGAEFGRSGNNINQLARHAHMLNHRGLLGESTIKEFNDLLKDYLLIRKEAERTMRQLIRLIHQ